MLVLWGRCRGALFATALIAVPLLSLGPAVAQDWTMTKTPSPTTYTAAGQVITYTYAFTSHVAPPSLLLPLTDTKVAPANISCPTNNFGAFATLTCTGTYTTTAADVAGGNISNTATASGLDDDGTPVTATATATV